jgi:phage portal protein BeeE
MAWFRRQRAQCTDPAHASGPLVVPARTASPGNPLALPTTYACVRLLTTTATQMRLRARVGDDSIPLPRWVRRPEIGSSQMRLRELVSYAVACVALRGYAAWWADPIGTGWDLMPLDPARLHAYLDPRGRRAVWHLDGQRIPIAFPASTVELRTGGLLVAPYLTVPGAAEPLGPLQAARHAVGGYLDTDSFAGNYFASGRGSSGRYLSTEADLPPETLAAYGDAWMAKQSGADGRMPVLGGGLKVEDTLLDPATAQWLESRTFNAQEVARLFGVPPRYLGLPSGDATTYATARDNDAAWLRYGVAAVVDPIADAWSSLLPAGRAEDEDMILKFDGDPLLRPTTLDRYQAHATALAAGWKTPDEVRADEGLQPLTAPQQIGA